MSISNCIYCRFWAKECKHSTIRTAGIRAYLAAYRFPIASPPSPAKLCPFLDFMKQDLSLKGIEWLCSKGCTSLIHVRHVDSPRGRILHIFTKLKGKKASCLKSWIYDFPPDCSVEHGKKERSSSLEMVLVLDHCKIWDRRSDTEIWRPDFNIDLIFDQYKCNKLPKEFNLTKL